MTPGGGSWPGAIDGEAAARIARLAFYGLFSIVLMTLDYRGGYVDKLRGTAWRALEPVVLLVEAPFSFASRLGGAWSEREAMMDRIARLERQRRISRARLVELEALRSDNEELRALLEASRRLTVSFTAAELMSIDLNPWSHRVAINRGGRDGLEAGQAVIDSSGLMGQVDDVGRSIAQVILISDPDHALPVRVRRTGLRTVAYGSGRINQLRLTDLPMNVDLRPGDTLETSGLGGAFPPGLPVAQVESVSRPVGEAFARAVVVPVASLDRARHVLVLDAVDQAGEGSAQQAEDESAGPDESGDDRPPEAGS